jgi:putative endonuclease
MSTDSTAAKTGTPTTAETKKGARAGAATRADKGRKKGYIERRGRRMDTARAGERLAVAHLEADGYEIIRRNYICRLGEIDVVARPRGKNMLCFVEIKCRRSLVMGHPYEAVGPRKQRRYRQIATLFLMREWNRLEVDAMTEFRFDVIEVMLAGETAEINHIREAF